MIQSIDPTPTLVSGTASNGITNSTSTSILQNSESLTQSLRSEQSPQSGNTPTRIYGLEEPSDSTVTLKITIIEAVGLSKKYARPNPNVLITLRDSKDNTIINGNSVATSSTQQKTLNPRYNEVFYFRVRLGAPTHLPVQTMGESASQPNDHVQVLNFEVQDNKSHTKTKIMGQFSIPLTINYSNGQEMRFNRDLLSKDLSKAKKPRGRLNITLKKINERDLNPNGGRTSSNESATNFDTNSNDVSTIATNRSNTTLNLRPHR